MLTDIMDFDPRITSDGNGYGAAYGVHCNFHYGYVHDVFDEDAKNEAACVQALRHLIAKADSEIEDLEDELAILQCQRKWAESDDHENFFAVCCAAFKRSIDSLTSNIQTLRKREDTVSDIYRPAERISDIINALIKSNFTELNEQSQEGDLHNEADLLVSSGSLNVDTDVRRQATAWEFSVKSEKQSSVLEKLDKPTQTISEESFSDAASYTIMELTEVGTIDSLKIEASEHETAEHASMEKHGFLTSIEPITSRSPLPACNDHRNTKPTAQSLCGDIESCMDGSKADESKSLILAVNTGVMLKVEEGHDTNIHDVSTGFFSKVQNQGGNDAAEGHVEDLEHHAQIVSDFEITYGRKKSRLSSTLKQSEKKVQRKPITKRKSSSIENFEQSESGSPCSKIGRSFLLPETNGPRMLITEENTAVGNPIQNSQAKKRQPKGAKSDFAGISSPEGKVLATTPLAKPELLPELDLESLRERVLEEPNFLKKLNVPRLRCIAKLCGIGRVAKSKKDDLIMELIKFLAT